MKEKILEVVYTKICEGFKTSFLTHTQFEKAFSVEENTLIEKLSSLIQLYFQLRNSDNKEVVLITKQEYVVKQFIQNYSYHSNEGLITLKEIEEKYGHLIKRYAESYNWHITKESTDFIVPLNTFIFNKTKDNVLLNDNNSNLSINYIFWNYIHNNYLRDNFKVKPDEVANETELIVKKFKKDYLSNNYLRLHQIAEKNISDENINAFDTVVINVGKRDFENGRFGWSNSQFQIVNCGKEYTFFQSTKDVNQIRGEFINIFIFQPKHIVKLSITLEEVERTPFIIQRDCEKVTLKNECELVIVKHHGNETIIFDTRKEALTFQTKLLEIREGSKYK